MNYADYPAVTTEITYSRDSASSTLIAFGTTLQYRAAAYFHLIRSTIDSAILLSSGSLPVPPWTQRVLGFFSPTVASDIWYATHVPSAIGINYDYLRIYNSVRRSALGGPKLCRHMPVIGATRMCSRYRTAALPNIMVLLNRIGTYQQLPVPAIILSIWYNEAMKTPTSLRPRSKVSSIFSQQLQSESLIREGVLSCGATRACPCKWSPCSTQPIVA